MDELPLGSGALAASTFDVDRFMTARDLEFSLPSANSLDGVSDRDYLIELCSCIAMIMMHLSRYCEELIIWSTDEFAFVRLSDAFTTGSSMMPQKKNPDMAELIRGKTGRAYGSLMGLLTVMKGLPLAYDKDMQEDKECVFDSIDTVLASLNVFDKMISSATFNVSGMKQAAYEGFLSATDLAEYLVKKGCAFRDAHFIIGGLVKTCIEDGRDFSTLTPEDLTNASPLFGEDAIDSISPIKSLESKSAYGGPNPKVVKEYLDGLDQYLLKFEKPPLK
jgi:argininosuccinate lyase